MFRKPENREAERHARQAELDGLKTRAERNRLGQFATPMQLASDVVAYGLSLLPATTPLRFFDPAIGTGSFYSALEATRAARQIAWARGFEIDPHYGEPAQSLWQETQLEITLADFTRQSAPVDEQSKATVLICNPPYVRHHHLDGAEKERLRGLARDRAGMQLSGLAGLYCYFMALAHPWMSAGGVAGWLIPAEFMDVNYGEALKQYLLREVTLLHIHRFDPNEAQFDDALVSSAVLWFRNDEPPQDHEVEFSYGGTLQEPAIVRRVAARDLRRTRKWTKFPREEGVAEHEGYRLGDLFEIKRGLATGDNAFFILDEQQVVQLDLPRRFLKPVLPGAKFIAGDEIQADEHGVPQLDKRLFLIDCDLPPEQIERDHPTLWSYLQTGEKDVAEGYLCSKRRCWYTQEKRPVAPIVCTYLGRSDHGGRPFRFLLNHSQATATNGYLLLYPKQLIAARLKRDPGALRALWAALNEIRPETLLGNGRVYGGGLHKLEPKELANVPADALAILAGLERKRAVAQLQLTEQLA